MFSKDSLVASSKTSCMFCLTNFTKKKITGSWWNNRVKVNWIVSQMFHYIEHNYKGIIYYVSLFNKYKNISVDKLLLLWYYSNIPFYKEVHSCHGRGEGVNISLFKCLLSIFIHRSRFCLMKKTDSGSSSSLVSFTRPRLCRIILKIGTMSIFKKPTLNHIWKGMFIVSNTSKLSTAVMWHAVFEMERASLC